MTENPYNLGVSASELLCTGRVKSYPDGSMELMACSAPVFKPSGWEKTGWHAPAPDVSPNGDRKPKSSNACSNERAMRRARAQVRDLALCTPFRWFVTLTLDRARVDRYDMKEITRHLNHWLDNQVRRRGLSYVLVPERHRDGAIHFHGFFNDALEAADSGTLSLPGSKTPRKPRSARQRAEWLAQGAHPVFNLPGWPWGFTTAIELYGEYPRAVNYVCKYIGKDGEKIGGRWYYSGGSLGRPEVSYEDISYREVAALPGAFTFTPEGSGLGFALARVPAEHYKEVWNDEMGRVGMGIATSSGAGCGAPGLRRFGGGAGSAGQAGFAGPGGVRTQAGGLCPGEAGRPDGPVGRAGEGGLWGRRG